MVCVGGSRGQICVELVRDGGRRKEKSQSQGVPRTGEGT